jgi:hypothetical protein
MKNIFIALAISCFLAVGMASQPNQAGTKKQEAPNPEGPSSITVNNEQRSAYNADHATDDPPQWYAPLERPDWWLVLVAAITGYVIWGQAREMRKTTDIMKRQADLQEAAMLQWIDVIDWQAAMTEDRKNIDIRFQILNPTNFPLTIKESFIVFGISQKRVKYVLSQYFVLSPRIPKNVQVNMWITEAESSHYLLDRLFISVEGMFRHTDMGPKKESELTVNGKLICGRFPTCFEPESIIPTKNTEKQST